MGERSEDPTMQPLPKITHGHQDIKTLDRFQHSPIKPHQQQHETAGYAWQDHGTDGNRNQQKRTSPESGAISLTVSTYPDDKLPQQTIATPAHQCQQPANIPGYPSCLNIMNIPDTRISPKKNDHSITGHYASR